MLGFGLSIYKSIPKKLNSVSVTYLLDSYLSSSIGAAYALRKLKTSALYACRVRESGGNTEANIGFDANGNLDTTALLTHCGSNSGYVTKWYDQSGNVGNDVANTTAANQPRIVNGGVIDRDFDTTKCAALYPTFASASGITKIANGNFSTDGNSDGLADSWSDNATGTTFSLISNTQKFTAVAQYGGLSQNITTVANRVYYVRANIKASSANVVIRFQGGSFPTKAHTGSGNYEVLSFLMTATGTTSNIRIYDGNSSGFSEVSVQDVFVVDITNLGQPAMYFDGSNDCLIKAPYPSLTEASALYPTFASASASNMVSNGDFSNGTTGWTPNNGSVSAANNTLTYTAGAQYGAVAGTMSTLTTGNRYFVSVKVKASSNLVKLVIYNGSQDIEVAHSGSGNYETLQVIVTSSTTSVQTFRVRDYRPSGFDSILIQEAVCVDVTMLDSTNIIKQPLYLNVVASSSATGNKGLVNRVDTGYVTSQYAIEQETGSNYRNASYIGLGAGNSAFPAVGTAPLNIQYLYSTVWNSNAIQVYVNGTTSGSSSGYSNSNLGSRANLTIGARSSNANNTTQGIPFNGKISEVIIMPTVAAQTAIENSQKSYFGIS